MRISRVYCCCAVRDIEVWAVASKFIPRYIEADSYYVIVPDSDAPAFRWITDPRFSVISESVYTRRFEAALTAAMARHGSARFGWYIQQFIKIAAMASGNPDDYVLIWWDADTIPVRKLSFFSEDGRIVFYTGSEYHKPYFDCIQRLNGLSKTIEESFIAQCLLGKSGWTADFLNSIQERFGKDPFQAIIEATDLSEKSGFSEYETLGTFFFSKYKNQFVPSKRNWERNGYSRLGSCQKLESFYSRFLLRNIDFVAFENWDLKNRRERQSRRMARYPIRTRLSNLIANLFDSGRKPIYRDVSKFIEIYADNQPDGAIIKFASNEEMTGLLMRTKKTISGEGDILKPIEKMSFDEPGFDMENALLCIDGARISSDAPHGIDWLCAPKYILVEGYAEKAVALKAFMEKKRFQYLGGSEDGLFVRTYSIGG